MANEERLKKVQTVKSDDFIVTITIDENGKLVVEVGSESSHGISKIKQEYGGVVVKQKFSTIEQEEDSENE